MRKIVEVELGARSGHFTQLILPAAPYAVLDALEKLRLEDGEAPTWDVLSVFGCERIADLMDEGGSLFELNVLCQQLALLDNRQLAIMEGLAEMEYRQNVRPISLPRLIDMAYSTDRCHIVEVATDNYSLGRFCAESGFVPEADNISDEAFELLDFARIGREFRQAEDGVFTSGGYVQRHDELRQVYKFLNLTPKKPDCTILAVTSNGCEVQLPYPANEPMGTESVCCVDCAAPALTGISGGMERMNLLARRLSTIEGMGTLTKLKAITEATGCDEVDWAINLADELEQYSFDPSVHDRNDVAKGNLSLILTKTEMELLLPHVNLPQYGQALIEADCGVLTGYGLIERNDGEPIHRMEQEPAPGGMEMMQ